MNTTTTKQSKHTPGPWHVGIKQAEQIVYDAKGNAVANATTYYFDSTKELCHANARLIASAPELLEALMRVRNAFYVDGTSKALREAFNGTKELVARATGTSEVQS